MADSSQTSTRAGFAPLLIVAAGLLIPGLAPPAEADPPATETPDIERLRELHHTEQEEVRLVQVPVVVTNRRGRIVQGLDKAGCPGFLNANLNDAGKFASQSAEATLQPISLVLAHHS